MRQQPAFRRQPAGEPGQRATGSEHPVARRDDRDRVASVCRDPGPLGRAYGRLSATGDYAISVTQPALFASYLAQQLDLLVDDFGVTIEIGLRPFAAPTARVAAGRPIARAMSA